MEKLIKLLEEAEADYEMLKNAGPKAFESDEAYQKEVTEAYGLCYTIQEALSAAAHCI